MACIPLPQSNVYLIGDSDIARWPKELLPSVTPTHSTTSNNHPPAPCSVSGHSGALLHQIIDPVQAYLKSLSAASLIASKQLQSPSEDQQGRTPRSVFLVVCAGENDIGSGVPLNKSNEAMESLLNIVSSVANTIKWLRVHLIILGPKLEPWLQDDPESRKAYIQMSRSFARICEQYNTNRNSNSDQASAYGVGKIHFLDCLTLFCEGANEPGALFGGRAIPQVKYFDDDQLHLSNEGYRLWKKSVEAAMHCILLMDH